MSVKQEDNKTQFIKKKGEPTGKIKLQREVPGYNQGFKFSIEEGNLNLQEEDSSITALNKYETYEVSLEDDGYFYFSRKKKALEVIKEKLGFPEECIETSTCELNTEKLKGIKFSGKGDSDTVTINGGGSTVTLKVDRGESSIFPMGHRFTLISDKEVTFTGSSPASIKANTNTEFKIKEEQGGGLSLERAWDINKLGEKIGLASCGVNGGSTTKCSLGSSISVYESNDTRVVNGSITGGAGKKITYEEGQDGYNQGFKFTAEEDIILGSGTLSGKELPSKISKDNGVSYEILEKTANNRTS